MKKFFIIAVILVMAANVYYSLTYKGDIRTPYYEFKTRIGTAPLKTYRDTDFGYTISYPCMFQQEDKQGDEYLGHARFVYSDSVNIILESYVTPNYSPNLQACADSLAENLHCDRTMISKKKAGKSSSKASSSTQSPQQDSAFLLSGPVYENDVRVDGYSHYDKFIKSGKMLFVYSLTYPDSYKPAMPRLFHLIEDWKVLGAF